MQLQNRLLGMGIALISLSPVAAHDVVIHAGTLIDGVGSIPRQRVSIQIKDDRIVAVQPGFVTPAGAEVIDLADSTVMPGFIDAHVHITAKLPSATNATNAACTATTMSAATRNNVG